MPGKDRHHPVDEDTDIGAQVPIARTPSAVEFDAADGTARVELNYSDSAALFEYLQDQ